MKFSIVIVCLNPGDKLNRTVDSVLCQTYGDLEIIIKDGGSRDGSLERLRARTRHDGRVRVFAGPDKGIYDAMNQAVNHVQGDYVLFLNCGDALYDEKVLERARDRIAGYAEGTPGEAAASRIPCPAVFYGDTYGKRNEVLISAPAVIDGFVCYRNIPCHQSCFYAVELCRKKPYELKYRVRADYEHFLWCYYTAKAGMAYLGMTVAVYEGGGYSESRENRKRDRAEHRAITKQYMSGKELLKYRGIMALTLAPLRTAMAESRVFSGVYHRMKSRIYR